jgi:flagellar basal body P-ring formation protein FlgA
MPTHAPLHRSRTVLQTGVLCWALLACGVLAQTPPAWTRQAQTWIDQQLGASPGQPQTPQALRPEVEVGQLDARLQLAPCAQVEPYLPPNTRLWGRSRIGLRCVEGPVRWNVFLPITVKAWGPAWVVRQPVAPGAVLTQADAELTEIDWAESVAPVLPQPDDWVGSHATRALMPGQVLRQGMVKPPQVFAAGSQVKVLVQGKGFQLTATGEALTQGYVGQPARVRMPDRRVLTGTVRDAETVLIQP